MNRKNFSPGYLPAEWVHEWDGRRNFGLLATFGKIYEGRDIAIWERPSVNNVFGQLLWEREECRTGRSENWQERDEQDWRECSEIQKGVQEGYSDVAEILLGEGKVHYQGKEYLLGNTMIRLRTEEEFWSGHFLLKNGDRCDARILIRRWCSKAFLVIGSETNDSAVFKLSDFYLLGLCNNIEPYEEYGMSIYCSTLAQSFRMDAVTGFSIMALKEMLLGEWLENKCAEAECECKGVLNTAEEEN